MVAFKKRLDAFYFQANNITIVRLQSYIQLRIEYFGDIQKELGIATTRIGKFTWTQFATWQKALQFYDKYHRKPSPTMGALIANPLLHKEVQTYEEIMRSFEGEGLEHGFTRVTRPVTGIMTCY